MNNSFEYFCKGKFIITYCNLCRKNIWPPAKNCSYCLTKTKKKILVNPIGTLLDFSYSLKDNAFFGIVDLYNIKIIGEIVFNKEINGQEKTINPHYGMKLKLFNCGKIKNTNELFFKFIPK